MRRLFSIRPLLDEGKLLRSTERTPTELRPYATGGSTARRGNPRFTICNTALIAPALLAVSFASESSDETVTSPIVTQSSANTPTTSEPLLGGEEIEAYLTELDKLERAAFQQIDEFAQGYREEFSEAENGEELISVTHEEWERALDDAGLVVLEFEESRPVPMMWFSPDGENWTVVDVNETFGTDHPPIEVVVGSESVLVKWSGLELTGYEEDETTGELEDQPDLIWVAKLVGTP